MYCVSFDISEMFRSVNQMQTKHHIGISLDENVSLYCEKSINELNLLSYTK